MSDEHNTIKLALLAGASAIEKNKRLHGVIFVLDPMGESLEITYHTAAILLRLMADCEINTEKIVEFAKTINSVNNPKG